MAARKHLPHIQRTREKIQASMLINRLTSFVKGDVELNAAQVTAALGLIKKVVPDLSAVEHSGEVVNRYDLSSITSDRLLQIESLLESAQSAGDSEGGAGLAEPHQVH